MLFAFGYSIFIWVWSLHLGIVFLFGYGLCIGFCACVNLVRQLLFGSVFEGFFCPNFFAGGTTVAV